MDGYISCSNNSRLFGGKWERNQAVSASCDSQRGWTGKENNSTSRSKNFTDWKAEEKDVAVPPTALDCEPVSQKTQESYKLLAIRMQMTDKT